MGILISLGGGLVEFLRLRVCGEGSVARRGASMAPPPLNVNRCSHELIVGASSPNVRCLECYFERRMPRAFLSFAGREEFQDQKFRDVKHTATASLRRRLAAIRRP